VCEKIVTKGSCSFFTDLEPPPPPAESPENRMDSADGPPIDGQFTRKWLGKIRF
jgi:hypothetical protein